MRPSTHGMVESLFSSLIAAVDEPKRDIDVSIIDAINNLFCYVGAEEWV